MCRHAPESPETYLTYNMGCEDHTIRHRLTFPTYRDKIKKDKYIESEKRIVLGTDLTF